MLRIQGRVLEGGGRRGLQLIALVIPEAVEEVGREQLPLGGQQGIEAGQGDGRDAHGALADAHADGLPRVPLGILGHRLLLPGPAGNAGALLLGQVDAGALGEAVLLRRGVDVVHVHARGQVVEVHVAALGDGLHHGEGAVARGLVAAEVAAVVVLLPRAVDGRLGRGDALLQGREGHQQLEGGARCVDALDGPVHHGPGEVVGQIAVHHVLAEPVQEEVRIIRGAGVHGQHAAVPQIQHHHGPGLLAHGLLGNLLHACVEGQVEAAAGGGVLLPEVGDFRAELVHQDALLAVHALQLVVAAGFEALLADGLAQPVEIGLGLHQRLVHLPHVAQHVARQLVAEVDAAGCHLHAQEGEPGADALGDGDARLVEVLL